MNPETIGAFVGAVLLYASTFIYTFLKNRGTNGHIDRTDLKVEEYRRENNDLRSRVDRLERDLEQTQVERDACEREKLRLMQRLLREGG